VTAGSSCDRRPFWQRKRLENLTDAEWESLCDRCGRCCLIKIVDDDTLEKYATDVACPMLDTSTGCCGDYPNRLIRVKACVQLTRDNIANLPWLPLTCGYRTVLEGRDLQWWHPLLSGRAETVREAGICITGRVIPQGKEGRLEYHTVDWPERIPGSDPRWRWHEAMFGGVNASVPTCFNAAGGIDLDLMAAQCFWLFTAGCHGLAILDKAGEVASLTIDQRIEVLEGLVERGVPASKLVAGTGPGSVQDSTRVAVVADNLGIRGLLIASAASGKIMPADVIPEAMRELLQRIPAALHVYLSLGVSPHAVPACLTALQAFAAQAPGRLTGIRDETAGCRLGLAAAECFRGLRFEVYTADETMLAELVGQGGAGLMSPGANLLGRPCRQVLDDAAQTPRPMIAAVARMLRSRPLVPAIKALLARHFAEPGWGRVRLPLRPLDASGREALFRAFDAIGMTLPPPVEN